MAVVDPESFSLHMDFMFASYIHQQARRHAPILSSDIVCKAVPQRASNSPHFCPENDREQKCELSQGP